MQRVSFNWRYPDKKGALNEYPNKQLFDETTQKVKKKAESYAGLF